MYGTIAHMRAKPGMEKKLTEHLREFEAAHVPGAVGVYVYRMDADPNEYEVAVVFESKESYFANANSPEQNARYEKLVGFLERAPEWHDGEIVYAPS